jgi:hypothetical protein
MFLNRFHQPKETLSQLVRRIHEQPEELYWKELLLDVARLNPAAARHRRLITDSLFALLEADDDRRDGEDLSRLFEAWRWADARRIIPFLLSRRGPEARWSATLFLSEIAEGVDDRRACLSLARSLLDQVPAGFTPKRGEAAVLEGSILLRQDETEFLRRFPALLAQLKTGPFTGRYLCEWLLFSGRERSAACERLLRAELARLPPQNRDAQREVELASRDGLAALERDDLEAVRKAIARARAFGIGAWYPAQAVLLLVRPLLRRRLLVLECRALLEALSARPATEALLPVLKSARRLR